MGRWLEEYGISIVLHGIILFALAMIHYETQRATPKVVQVSSEMTDAPGDDFTETEAPAQTQELSTGAPAAGLGIGEAGEALAGLEAPPTGVDLGQDRLMASSLRDDNFVRPLAGGAGSGLGLSDNIPNLIGAVANTGGGGKGDAASVDRITLEIKRQLDKGKLVVAWVLDASGSQKQRSRELINRFEKIYKELDEQKDEQANQMLTGIVAFGQKTLFMTEAPTADPAAFKKAVANIPEDESGKENIFAAVKETCIKWRKYQTQDRRNIMIIVVTDEIGDDPSLLEETIQLTKRNKIPVYVLGPMAPFGKQKVDVTVRDEKYNVAITVPIDRGPESLQPEFVSLPYWDARGRGDTFPSGFGPYALSRLARESGGIYFVIDDGIFANARFDSYEMIEYQPDYMSLAEYKRAMQKHPLRVAVIAAIEQSKGALGQPPSFVFRTGQNNVATDSQRVAAQTLYFVDHALEGLKKVEKQRDAETSRRWQAHYDLTMGRLLAAKVRCNEYNWVLAQIKSGAKEHTEGKNAWKLEPNKDVASLSFGVSADNRKRETNVGKMDSKATEKAKAEAEAALKYLHRVVKEHPGTPWELMAKRELDIALGYTVGEIFIETPKPPPPPTAMTAKQKEDAKARQEALEKLKKKNL